MGKEWPEQRGLELVFDRTEDPDLETRVLALGVSAPVCVMIQGLSAACLVGHHEGGDGGLAGQF